MKMNKEYTWALCRSCVQRFLLFFFFKVVAKKYRDFDFPPEMTGISRYLNNAYARDEFTNTCPADQEIEYAYLDVAKRMK